MEIAVIESSFQHFYFARVSIIKMLKTAFYNSYFHSLFLKKHHVIPGVKYIVPLLFVLSLICFFIAGFFHNIGWWAFVGLLFLHQTIALYSSISFWKQNGISIVILPLLFLGLHIAYGLGLLAGVINFFIFKRKAKLLYTSVMSHI